VLSKLFNVRAKTVEIQSSISRTSDSTVKAVQISFVLSVRIETGFMKKRVLKTEKDQFAVVNNVVKN
jgi:hypothetical protein